MGLEGLEEDLVILDQEHHYQLHRVVLLRVIRKLYVLVTTVISPQHMFPKVTEALQICSHLKTILLRLSQSVGDLEVLKTELLEHLYVEAQVLEAGPVVQFEGVALLAGLVQLLDEVEVVMIKMEQLLD